MRQRTISDFFWRDPEISDLSQEDKATLLYFLTAPSSNIVGCYKVVWMIAAAEMGWTKDQLFVVAKRLRARDLIDFTESGWIWVKEWWKHNSAKGAFSPKLFENAKKQCASIPVEWRNLFGVWLANVGVDTLSIGYAVSVDTLSDTTPIPYGYPMPYPIDRVSNPVNTGEDTLYHTLPDRVPHTLGPNTTIFNIQSTTTTPPVESVGNLTARQNLNVEAGAELIFPLDLSPQQQESIRTQLFESGLHLSVQQALLDELHGAQLAKQIENPIGYIRVLIERATHSRFVPERATVISTRRDQERALSSQLKQEPITSEQIQAQLQRLPQKIRDSLSKIQHK
jgi:hypothetical protein